MLHSGKLVNRKINTDQTSFSLEGMICPTFQNQGIARVMINGLVINKDESYCVNVPTIVLTNSIDILFLDEVDRNLVLSYVSLECI